MLTALLCLALDDRPLFLTEATRLLFCELSRASRRLLGVPGTVSSDRAFLAAYRRVRYCFRQICSVVDPSPLPKNRRLAGQDLKARIRKMIPGQAEAARDRLEALANALIEASISVLDEEERAAFDGCTGLDATPVPLFSRGPSKRTGLCASDPDGGWYVREGDHREREDDKGRPLRKICWALEATIATTARPPGAPPATPNLAIGMAMTRPGEDPGGTGARVLASVAARGHKTGWLGYDRAYTQALPGRFHLPARALGYHPVMDYRDDQLGIQANSQRRLLVEGTLVLPRPARAADHRHHPAARSRHHPRPLRPADRRPRPYQLKRKDGPDADGYQRLSCPAPGTHPEAHLPAAPGLAVTPRRARQGIPATARTAQDLPPDRDHHPARTSVPATARTCPTAAPPGTPGTPRLRNTIEGLNGYAKDPAHQALAQPGRRRVRGIAAQSMFTALLLIAANIRKIRAWRALTARGKARITQPGTAAPGQPRRATSPTADTAHRSHATATPPASRPAQARPSSLTTAATTPSTPRNRPERDQRQCQTPAPY